MKPADLPAGTTIGHYVVEQLVAIGGSAAVYRARDPRAGRQVALKILLDQHEVRDEAVRRLLHEARVYTRLVHPHIVTLYEVGEEEGRSFLAMEWVEGVTLADKMAGAPLPEAEAVRLLTQVADALSAAHALGLAHRDLKPANIMITDSGEAKLLDFGLVKGVVAEGGPASSWHTIDGGLLGTPAYMAPEQARGEELRLASDVFSFGVIMYELLTGQSPFARATTLDTLNAVAHAEIPQLPPLRSSVGRGLRRLLSRCLARDPGDRPRDARELVVELQRVAKVGGGASRPRGPLQGAAVGLLLGLLLGALWLGGNSDDGSELPERGVRTLAVEGTLPVLTSQGDAVIHCSRDGREIWISPLGTGNPELIWAGAESIGSLAVTPDARWVLFSAADGDSGPWIWEVPSSGGLPRKVTRGAQPAVVGNGQSLAAFERIGPHEVQLFRCRRDGSERRVIRRFTGSMMPRSCAPLADEILVVLSDGLRRSALLRVDPSTGTGRELCAVEGVAGRGLAVGPHAAYALWSLRRSARSAAMIVATGVADGITHGLYSGPGLASRPSIDRTGSRIAFEVQRSTRQLLEVTVQPGSTSPSFTMRALPGTLGASQPRVSPDATRLAYQSARGDLWVMERASGSLGPLLTTGDSSFNPAWSPDGHWLAYSCLKNHRSALWMARADGGDPRPITDDESNSFQPVWHPDGRHLLFISDRDGAEELYCLRVDSGEITRLTRGGAANPDIAPGGQLVVYSAARESGGALLTLARLSEHADTLRNLWQRPVDVDDWAGAKCRFSPDGRWLAFDLPADPLGADIWALPVVGGDTAEAVRLTAFSAPLNLLGWFDWADDTTLVLSAASNPVELLLLEDAERWLQQIGTL